MARTGKKATRSTQAPWATPGERVKWLLADRWAGSRSAMARAIKMSLAGVVKVVTAQQEPGRQILTAIVESTDVNAHWLLTGQGEPYTASAIPIVDQAIPGPPAEHPDLLSADKIGNLGGNYSSTQYWLRIGAKEPIAHDPSEKVKQGDLILIETDRSHFPAKELLWERICVVRFRSKVPEIHLATVSWYDADHEDGERIEADIYGGRDLMTQYVIDVIPGRAPEVRQRHVRIRPKGAEPIRLPDRDSYPVDIDYHDIVGISIRLVRLIEPTGKS